MTCGYISLDYLNISRYKESCRQFKPLKDGLLGKEHMECGNLQNIFVTKFKSNNLEYPSGDLNGISCQGLKTEAKFSFIRNNF